MNAIPAKIAKVKRIVLANPRVNGKLNSAVMYVARKLGIKEIFSMGGAQAIAALAYGTASIPKVDKICGPGGLFVTLAKQEVYGNVGVDAIYGPTETVIIADESADPELIAADLLAQAEHDRLASPILLTPSRRLAEKVKAAIKIQMQDLERAKIAAEAFGNRGGCVLVSDLDEAIQLANEYAPEHLCLVVEDPTAWVTKVKNAGGVFLGEASPEAVGDYTAGPSHTMPTGGSARWSSPLGVSEFLKTISVVNIASAEAEELAAQASIIARAEGLTAHAASVERRIQGR